MEKKFNVEIVNETYSDNTKNNFTFNILFLVLAFLIIVALVRKCLIGDPNLKTFSDFLQFITNFNSIDLSSTLNFRFFDLSNGAPAWDILGLTAFANEVGSILGFGVWLIGGFLNLLLFALNFLSFLLI